MNKFCLLYQSINLLILLQTVVTTLDTQLINRYLSLFIHFRVHEPIHLEPRKQTPKTFRVTFVSKEIRSVVRRA